MCGIFCKLILRNSSWESIESITNQLKVNEQYKTLLKNRGPDSDSSHTISADNFDALFYGCVLWQQGTGHPTEQPIVNDNLILLMNGDLFMLGINEDGTSDVSWLSEQLKQCQDDEVKIIELFASLEGPFSIIYYNKRLQCLYFLRDSLGRNSLLLQRDDSNTLTISSVLGYIEPSTNCIELPPLGIYKFNEHLGYCLYPWKDSNYLTARLQEFMPIFERTIDVKQVAPLHWLSILPNHYEYTFKNILINELHVNHSPEIIIRKCLENPQVLQSCDHLIDLLTKSVRNRIEASPPYCKNCIKEIAVQPSKLICEHNKIGILFSGGIDCSILAVLAAKLTNGSIDLFNVSFEKIKRSKLKGWKDEDDYNTPDRISAKESLKELQRIFPAKEWNLIEINVTRRELEERMRSRISHLVYPLRSVLDESLGAALYFASLGHGYHNGHKYQTSCRVLLIGSGADELFGGYTRHRNAYVRGSYELLSKEMEMDWLRLPSRNLARDDRVIADNGITVRAPYIEERFCQFVLQMSTEQKCYHSLEQGLGDKLLLRLCGYRLGLRDVCWLKKRALQFGSRIADRKQNANDESSALCYSTVKMGMVSL